MIRLLPLVLLLACAPKKPVDAPAPEAPAPAPADVVGPRPEVGPEVPFTLPTPETAQLSNGAGVWVVSQPSLPLVTLVVSVPGGSSLDAPGKEGTAAIADRLLTQGAGKLTARQFAAAVERLGIQLDVDTGRAGSTVTMSFVKDKMEPALDLLADMIVRPRLTSVDFARERAILLSDLKQAQDEPVAVAAKIGWSQWFGQGHPYGRPPDGTVKGMAAVTPKDVNAYHTKAWNAAGARLTVTGAVTKDEIVAALEPRLGKPWKAGTAAKVELPAPPPHDQLPIVVVDKP
ncbi:MAG: M16 family metallopeptidase, partial [Myxococcota bacterium]